MILFCLPYAGGSEAIYFEWKKYLDPSIKLHPIELKGRGKRFNEPFYENIQEAVEDIFNNIKDKIEYDEYAIYGHSMGSLLAYELYYKIDAMQVKKPKHIFFSGYKAPNILRKKENIYTLPNYDFMNKVIEFGGTPEDVINNKELLDLFIPILKNDFKILETYEYIEKEKKIQCDISILNGKQDSITLKDILAWNKHGGAKCRIYEFDGNHFFINSNVKDIVDIINTILIN
ncbi:thioesterase II family protein [Inconstantimicrobium mannanitabidum]|uniref:Thioesterase n=1 Tax=Inconstantimicrobium mannanitabidum TaxID=1604901 RepID=A0ACB5R847_9CLOT|nr:thioesterase domain-containing protein [Clostridium sp. TW13]GKX65194.1 thioesterase [Clostridium sp. TW13]